MFKNYPKSAEQLNDTTLKQMLMVHRISECHFVIIWTFANSCLCFCVLSEFDIVPAESTDIIDRTMSTAAPTAPSLTVDLQANGQTSNMPVVASTKRKSKASYTETKQGDQKLRGTKHICKVCDKECRTSSVLKAHIRVHSGERPYMCKICDKLFSQKYSLAQHMRLHSGDNPYKCKVCDKCFSQSGSLASHMTFHTGDKPYKSKVCDKWFSYSSHIAVHMRIHTGDKPYQCNVCGKCFSQSCNLAAHMPTHNGDKPYQCKVCDKCFSLVFQSCCTHAHSHW